MRRGAWDWHLSLDGNWLASSAARADGWKIGYTQSLAMKTAC
jgi:hypothetical protein